VIMTRIARMVMFCLIVGVLAVSIGNTDNVDPSASELVAKLQGPLGMYGNDSSLGEALIALGNDALPAIEQGITQGDPQVKSRLLLWVMGIPGERATALLLRVMSDSQEPRLRGTAIRCLAERPVTCPLTAKQLATLQQTIAEGNGWIAGEASRALARCEVLSADERVHPILARFQAEVMTPAQPHDRTGDSYLSTHVRRLNLYLRAFSYAGEIAVPYVRQAVKDAASGDVRKWLTIASGMAGDGQVTDDLERIIRENPDTSTRVEATRAYARSAKEAAIPFLLELLDDPAEIQDRFTWPDGSVGRGMQDGFRPVAGIAADELSRLGRNDLVLSHRRSTRS